MIPRLVRVGIEQTVTISPIGVSKSFDDSLEYTVSFIPKEIYDADRFAVETKWNSVTVHSENGRICVSCVFDSEQEWVILVTNAAQSEKGSSPIECNVYALLDDLYERTPWNTRGEKERRYLSGVFAL